MIQVSYFKYSCTPGRRSPTICYIQLHVSLFECFEQTYTSILPVKSHIMRIRCHFDVTTLNNKHVCSIFLKRYARLNFTIAIYVKQKMATSGVDAAHKTVFQLCFQSGLTSIDMFVNGNQQNATRMFQQHVHIIGTVDIAAIELVIHLVGGQSIRIAD